MKNWRTTTNGFYIFIGSIAFLLASEGIDWLQQDDQPQATQYQAIAHADPNKPIPETDADKIDTDEDEVYQPDTLQYYGFFEIDIIRSFSNPGQSERTHRDRTWKKIEFNVVGLPSLNKIVPEFKENEVWTGDFYFIKKE